MDDYKINEEKFLEYEKYFIGKITEPCNLSDDELQDLALEYYDKFIAPDEELKSIFPERPSIVFLDNDISQYGCFISYDDFYDTRVFKFNSATEIYLHTIFNKHIRGKIGINEVPFFHDMRYRPIKSLWDTNYEGFGGALYTLGLFMIVDKFFPHYLEDMSEKNKVFWDWYKRSWNVLGFQYYDTLEEPEDNNTIWIYKKPEFLEIKYADCPLTFKSKVQGREMEYIVNGNIVSEKEYEEYNPEKDDVSYALIKGFYN